MEDKKIEGISGAAVVIIATILLVSIAFLSCKTVYVPTESVRTEYTDRFLHDSIYVSDSVYIRDRGDTVFKEKWKTKYVERLRVDSFIRHDSIHVPYPVEVTKEVEAELSWWQSLKMETGGITLGVLGVILIYFIVKIVRSVKSVGWRAALKLIFKIL
jgi:hypothetical protein